MRLLGTQAMGIRTPIINRGDDLVDIITNVVSDGVKSGEIKLEKNDVIGITEAVVAKAQGNFAELNDLSCDVKKKFPGGELGIVFPIMSRNRFYNILKGIAGGADKVFILLCYPSDEVGNPIIGPDFMDDRLNGLLSADEFKKIVGEYTHPFTGVDYISLYQQASDNIEVYLSNNPCDILKLTKHVLAAEIHNRFRTKTKLLNAGAETVYTLSDILNESVNGSGFNPEYGVLGSNLATEHSLKLFPRDCKEFISRLRESLLQAVGVEPELLIYGDGAFKDPACGIWELADPVVSPAYTQKLDGSPSEIKLKFVAENLLEGMTAVEKHDALTKMIKNKGEGNIVSEGTTPRKYADLLGSLCDLLSGSGDKGTPVVLIQGYFDNYADE